MAEGDDTVPTSPAPRSPNEGQETGVSAELRTFLDSTDTEMRRLVEEVRKEIPNLNEEQLDNRILVIERVMQMLSNVEMRYRPTVGDPSNYNELLKEMYLNLGMILSAGGILFTEPGPTGKLAALLASATSVLLSVKMFARVIAPDATRAFLRSRTLSKVLGELKQARAEKDRNKMLTHE